MYYNKLSRAGLALLGCFLFCSAVSAAPLSVRDYATTSSDADVPRHLTAGATAEGIIHHISAVDQSSQTTPPSNPPSIFKRDGGELQFVFPARRSPKNKFKAAFKKLGSGIKRIGKAVTHFVVENKNKIAKIGLKVLSVAEKYAGKALANVPGVGKVLSKGLEVASKYTDQASNRIHANLGGKLGKAMAGMDKAEHIAGFLRR